MPENSFKRRAMEKYQKVVKKFSLFLFLSFIISGQAYGTFCYHNHYIVSDFDDTIKTYHSKGLFSKLYYALFKKDINAGFDVLFKEMVNESLVEGSKDCTNDLFTVLSASNKVLKRSVKRLLKKQKFPKSEIILKSAGLKTFEYKTNSLISTVTRMNIPFILIGDDTSYDPAAYRKFELMGFEVLNTYIHNVNNRKPFPGQKLYLTAFDIALSEYLAGRLSEDAVLKVGTAVIHEKSDHIIPPYGHCPEDLYKKELDIPEKIKRLRNIVGQHISEICSSRSRFSSP